MPIRRLTWLEDQGGGKQKLKEQKDDDVPLNAVDSQLIDGDPHKLIYTDSSGTIRSLTVGTDSIIGHRALGAGIEAMTAAQARALLNVEGGAELNKAINIGTDLNLGTVHAYKQRNGVTGELEFRALAPVKRERLYLIEQTNRLALDPLVVPFGYTMEGADIDLGGYHTLFKNNSQQKLLMEVNAVLQGTSPDVGFRIIHNTTRTIVAGT